MGVLLAVGLYVAIRLGALPGQVAKRRGHPQADTDYSERLGMTQSIRTWDIEGAGPHRDR